MSNVDPMPLSIRLAIWWAAHGIRGRGAVARAVGRWQRSDCSLFIKTQHGGALSVDFGNFDIYANVYNSGGCFDANVMNCCERLLRAGDVFFDIGANAGVYVVDFARLIPDLTAFAFEPQPSLANHIRRSIEANRFDRVKVLELALGKEDGEASLFLTSHSIHASMIPRERRYRELRVPVRTLDSLAAAGEVAPPDLIKIDVEGSELNVFLGADDMLKSYRPSIVFEADENMIRMGHTMGDLIAVLTKAAPYRFFLIDDQGIPTPTLAPYPFGNYLALSPRHADRI
jgi:FkbM family methyltransferase